MKPSEIFSKISSKGRSPYYYRSRWAGEGVHLLRNNPLDLVYSRYFMPEMDGLEVINIVQLEFPGIPILAISGGTAVLRSNTFLKAARQFGALDVLSKPITRKKLMSTISVLLKKS